MSPQETVEKDDALIEYVLRLADDRLILGHRLSEWAGHGPILEEDIALSNVALDYIGHAANLYEFAATLEGSGIDRDDLVYFRDELEYLNIKMVELPKGDFGFTIARQFLFSAWSYFLYEALHEVADEQLRGIIQKHFKEIKYHLRHSKEWVLRLGDGTDESHRRIQQAFDELWTYTGELFYSDEIDEFLAGENLAADPADLRQRWEKLVSETLEEATLSHPDPEQFMAEGGRRGQHTEALGPLLAEMQYLQRSYPDGDWN